MFNLKKPNRKFYMKFSSNYVNTDVHRKRTGWKSPLYSPIVVWQVVFSTRSPLPQALPTIWPWFSHGEMWLKFPLPASVTTEMLQPQPGLPGKLLLGTQMPHCEEAHRKTIYRWFAQSPSWDQHKSSDLWIRKLQPPSDCHHMRDAKHKQPGSAQAAPRIRR